MFENRIINIMAKTVDLFICKKIRVRCIFLFVVCSNLLLLGNNVVADCTFKQKDNGCEVQIDDEKKFFANKNISECKQLCELMYEIITGSATDFVNKNVRMLPNSGCETIETKEVEETRRGSLKRLFSRFVSGSNSLRTDSSVSTDSDDRLTESDSKVSSKKQRIEPIVDNLELLDGEIDFGDQKITFKTKLGQGRDGDIWLISSSLDPSKLYAAKVFKSDSKEGKNELAVLKKLGKSRYIVPSNIETLSFSADKTKYTVLLEEAAVGSLKDSAPKINRAEPRTQVSLVLDILEGVQYLHENEFLHNDIHSGNFLVLKNGHAVLADFGTTKKISKYRSSAKKEENKVAGKLIKNLFSESILKRVAKDLISSGDIVAAISSVKKIAEKLDLKNDTLIAEDLAKNVFSNHSTARRPGLERSANLGPARATNIVKEVEEAEEVETWSKSLRL